MSFRGRSIVSLVASSAVAAVIALGVFYVSLLATSTPLNVDEQSKVDKAINVLEAKGFIDEAILLKHATVFRSSDHWFNAITLNADSYAATNFPFQIVTLHPDFYSKAADSTERAMILLHEAAHLRSMNEADAYAYVWQNREALSWTQLTHGTTPAYVTISDQTREFAPQLFTCPDRLWSDCTEGSKDR